MNLATTKWPIIAPNKQLVTLAEITRRFGLSAGSVGNMKKWIVAEGFSFSLARLADGNQLTLCVTADEWKRIKARREARGFVVAEK